jgi:hypothetical protein
MFFQTKKHFKTQLLLYYQIPLFYRKHMVCPKNVFEGDIYIGDLDFTLELLIIRALTN